MIIVCPDCSKPYELPDNQISALVQIACPHCAHAVILDFEAANDPSLQEPGHQLTSGFLSREAYEQSVSGNAQAPAANRAPVASTRVEPKPPKAKIKPLDPGPKTPKPGSVSTQAPAPISPVPAAPAARRTTTPPPAHPAPPAPPGTRANKQRPRPPVPVPQAPAAAATPSPVAPILPPEPQPVPAQATPEPTTAPNRSDAESGFPHLGPGFGEAAPELPPMPSKASGDRPNTVTIDLNQAALGQQIFGTPASDKAPAAAASSAPAQQDEIEAAPAQSVSDDPQNEASNNLQNGASTQTSGEQSMQAALSDTDLEPVKKSGSWIWWIIAAILLAGGGVWGWTMMQQSQHAESAPTLGAPQ